MTTVPHLSALLHNDYVATWNSALTTYDKHPQALKYKNLKPDELYQTKERPMHPQLFYSLSQVRGFNNLNGYRYEDYYKNFMDELNN